MVFPDTKSKIPVRTPAPATSAPLVTVQSFAHNSTATSTVCLFAVVPEAAHRLQVFCFVSFLNDDLPHPFRAQVRQVVGLLICVQRKLCCAKSSIWLTGYATFFLPPRVQRFPNMPNSSSVFLTESMMSMDPRFGNVAVPTHFNRGSFCADASHLGVLIVLVISFLCLVSIFHRCLVCAAPSA